MNPTRRGLLGGLAALVAGGKSVAKEIDAAVSSADLAQSIGIRSTLQQPIASNSWLSWINSATGREINRRRNMRQLAIHGGLDPWIASLKSVPLATKARMQIDLNEADEEAETLFQKMARTI